MAKKLPMKTWTAIEYDLHDQRETGRTEEYDAVSVQDAAIQCANNHHKVVEKKYKHKWPGATRINPSGCAVWSDGMFYYFKEKS